MMHLRKGTVTAGKREIFNKAKIYYDPSFYAREMIPAYMLR